MTRRRSHREALAAAMHYRLGLLLALQCLSIFAVGPIIEQSPVIRPVGGTVFGLMFIAGMALMADRGWLRHLLIGTGVAILALEFWRYADPSPPIILLYSASLALFLIVLSVTLALILASRERVTTDVLMGAVALYLNVGLIFAAVYAFIENIQPGAIAMPDRDIGAPLHPLHFLYFSLVTLTTVGYGDTVPVSALARSLATMEAAMGQLYPAIILARLVSMHVAEGEQR
ncbi:MAG: ion channel [Geminicoccaceae bacterium]